MTMPDTACATHSLVLRRSSEYACVVTRIAIVGDFLPAGNIPAAEAADWRGLAKPLLPHFADVANTFANLECPIDVGDLPASPLNGIGEIVSAPGDVLEYLDALNCRSVGLANNHALDFGVEGARLTREALSRKHLIPLGAGRTLNGAPEVFVWRGPGNLRVGFWAAARATHHLATNKAAGVEPATRARATEALAAMRRQDATFCVALLHAGSLRTNRPAPEDVQLLRSLAASGFDLIAASHSHRIAGFESVAKAAQFAGQRPAYCFYGLGSIVSGYIASGLEREGLIVIVGFDSKGALAEISVRPVYIAPNGVGEVPAPEMSRAILSRVELLSEEISNGSYKRFFYKEISNGLIRLYVRDAHTAFRQSGLNGLMRKAARMRVRHVKKLLHRVLAT